MPNSRVHKDDRLIRVVYQADGTLDIEMEAQTAPSEVEGMGFAYAVLSGMGQGTPGLARGRVPAGAEVPAHKSDNPYALLVIAGECQLVLADATGNRSRTLDVGTGDLVLFPPGAMHAWNNCGDEVFEWFGVDVAS